MVVYLITGLGFALILVFAYRSLGGEVASEADVTTFLASVQTWVGEDAAKLAFMTSDHPPSEVDVATAREVRKKLSGYQQQLNRLTDDPGERSDLSRAIESLGWACRMVETGAAGGNEGVATAVGQLYEFAMRLLSRVPEATASVGSA